MADATWREMITGRQLFTEDAAVERSTYVERVGDDLVFRDAALDDTITLSELSAGAAKLKTGVVVVDSGTGDYSLSAEDSGKTIYVSANRNVLLPAPAVGLEYTIHFTGIGRTIVPFTYSGYIAGNGYVGDYCYNSTAHSSITLVAVSTQIWVVKAMTGEWAIEPI